MSETKSLKQVLEEAEKLMSKMGIPDDIQAERQRIANEIGVDVNDIKVERFEANSPKDAIRLVVSKELPIDEDKVIVLEDMANDLEKAVEGGDEDRIGNVLASAVEFNKIMLNATDSNGDIDVTAVLNDVEDSLKGAEEQDVNTPISEMTMRDFIIAQACVSFRDDSRCIAIAKKGNVDVTEAAYIMAEEFADGIMKAKKKYSE